MKKQLMAPLVVAGVYVGCYAIGYLAVSIPMAEAKRKLKK